MDWQIQADGKTWELQIPDGTLRGRIPVKWQGKAYELEWSREQQKLTLWEGDVARVWRLRNFSCSQFVGDPQRKVQVEMTGSGVPTVLSAAVAVTPYIPGLPQGAKDQGVRPVIVRSPMAGKVLKVFAKDKDRLGAGDAVMIIEAMKMENRITAPIQGSIHGLKVKEGENIGVGVELYRMQP